MAHPLNEAVAAQVPRVEALAASFANIQGVEFDDLVQEGLIAVWQSLEKGIEPSQEFIRNRMRDWVRYERRQLPADYADMLPLETVSELHSR